MSKIIEQAMQEPSVFIFLYWVAFHVIDPTGLSQFVNTILGKLLLCLSVVYIGMRKFVFGVIMTVLTLHLLYRAQVVSEGFKDIKEKEMKMEEEKEEKEEKEEEEKEILGEKKVNHVQKEVALRPEQSKSKETIKISPTDEPAPVEETFMTLRPYQVD